MKSNLTIIELKNYNRKVTYDLPILPSPNLPNRKSINLYPSLCLFEGTNVRRKRTEMQFQIYGSPYLNKEKNNFRFTPKKIVVQNIQNMKIYYAMVKIYRKIKN